MAKKMDLVQQLVGAVVVEDYEQITSDGTELDRLAELQSWFVLPTAEYAQYSEEFREAAQDVAEAGEHEDSEAAAGGYAVMIEKCLQCHQYMKRVASSGEGR